MHSPISSPKAPCLSGELYDKRYHRFWIRVYLADTDAGGMVYHANYLTFAEKARTEFLNLMGIQHAKLMQDASLPCFFVVRECKVSFLKSAVLGDLLEIQTHFLTSTKARLFLQQDVFRENVLIARLHIVLACVKNLGVPVGIPPSIVTILRGFLPENSVP